jgi:hypothetical protein
MKWLLAGVEREVLRLVAEVVRQNILNFTTDYQICFSSQSMHSTHSHSCNSFHVLRLCVGHEVARGSTGCLNNSGAEQKSQDQNALVHNHTQLTVQLAGPKETMIRSEGARSRNVLDSSWW